MTSVQNESLDPSPSASAGPTGVRRALWAGIDQIAVATSALLAAITVARGVPSAEFGAFALVLLGRVLILEVGRSLTGQPLQILRSENPDERRSDRSGATSFALALGAAFGLASLLLAGVLAPINSLATPYLLVLAASAPLVLLHDVVVHDLFARSQPKIAAVLNLSVLGLQIVLVAVLTARGDGGWPFFAAWGAAVMLVASFELARLRLGVSFSDGRAWPRRTKAIAPGLFADASLVQVQRQLSAWLLLAFGSLAAVAGYRGTQTAFRPLGVATSGARLVALPAMAQAERAGQRAQGERRALQVSALLTAVAAIGTLLLLVLPERVGADLLGATWSEMRAFLIPVGVAQAAQGAAVGAQLLLNSRGATQRLAQLRLRSLAVHIVGLVIGGVLDGAIGAAIALAVTNVAVLPIWWWTARVVAPTPDSAPLDHEGTSL